MESDPHNVYAAPATPVDVAPEAFVDAEPRWWRKQWPRYNRFVFIPAFVAVVIAGALTLIFADVFDQSPSRVYLFFGGLLVSAVLGLPYMALANLCYLLGPFGEYLVPAQWRDAYRKVTYNAGLVIAVFIPSSFTIVYCIGVAIKVRESAAGHPPL